MRDDVLFTYRLSHIKDVISFYLTACSCYSSVLHAYREWIYIFVCCTIFCIVNIIECDKYKIIVVEKITLYSRPKHHFEEPKNEKHSNVFDIFTLYIINIIRSLFFVCHVLC